MGFILSKEGEIFPKISLYFIAFNGWLLISLWGLHIIQEEPLSTIISQSRVFLPSIYFPLLYLLFRLFLANDYEWLDCWIGSFCFQTIILQLLTFILKKEDEDEDKVKKGVVSLLIQEEEDEARPFHWGGEGRVGKRGMVSLSVGLGNGSYHC